jgi:bifunctional non-homologous end joining protein LigD
MHEIKFDGYRLLASVKGEAVRLMTRTGLDWTERFQPSPMRWPLWTCPRADRRRGGCARRARQSEFFSAAGRFEGRRHAATCLFRLRSARLSGEDLKPLPNIERKERLEALLAEATSPIHVAEHIIGAGEKLLTAMCRAGQEGIIAKRADAPYRGDRTRNWVKVKCTLRQEFVVMGWTKSPARAVPSAPCCSAKWKKANWSTRARSAPASTRRCSRIWPRPWLRWLARQIGRGASGGSARCQVDQARAGG